MISIMHYMKNEYIIKVKKADNNTLYIVYPHAKYINV